MRVLPAIFLSLGLSRLPAQDGGQLYGLYCSACHAEDGAGATGGAFPPLAGSRWVTSDPALPVKVVLHGLKGPVEVLGKTYDLEMPPQGAMLADDQIAAIITYIRGAWGNGADAVTADFVKNIRAAHQGQSASWTAEELLKAHPLPFEETALKNLTSRYYLGEWDDIPDFSKLKAENIEEELKGVISLSHAPVKDHFGVVWEAEFDAPADGKYTFMLDADDGARVLINGKTLIEVRGKGPMNGSRAKRGQIDLKKGLVPIRIEYFEARQHEGIILGWRGPGVKNWRWLSENAGSSENERQSIPIEPSPSRAVVYRNFIAGSTPRAIGIGFPGGMNFAWSADHFAPERAWTGEFMDGSRHWIERGQGRQEPSGNDIVTLSNAPALALRGETSGGWPTKSQLAPVFKGYKLDPAGNPVFAIDAGSFRLLDEYKNSGSDALLRTLKVVGNPEKPTGLLLARGIPVEPLGNSGGYRLDNLVTLRANRPLRFSNGELVLPLEANASVEIRYTWD